MGHWPMDRPIRSILACDADNHEGVVVQMRSLLRRTLTRLRLAYSQGESAAAPAGDHGGEGILLTFPIRGEALLVRLAERLRDRLPSGALEEADPFLLTLSRGLRPKLSIDREAYVEFHAESASFHLVIDASPESRVTLQTTDYDTLVKFAVQYMAEERRDFRSLEVASS
jgi:hypothetical protein